MIWISHFFSCKKRSNKTVWP